MAGYLGDSDDRSISKRVIGTTLMAGIYKDPANPDRLGHMYLEFRADGTVTWKFQVLP